MEILFENDFADYIPNLIYHYNFENDLNFDFISACSNPYDVNINLHCKGKEFDSEMIDFANAHNIQVWLHMDKNSDVNLIHRYGMCEKLTAYYEITDEDNLLNIKRMNDIYSAYHPYHLDIRMIFSKDYNGNVLEWLDEDMNTKNLGLLDELMHMPYQYFYRFYCDSKNYIPYYFFKQNGEYIEYSDNKVRIEEFFGDGYNIQVKMPKKCNNCDVNIICPRLEYYAVEDCYERYSKTLKMMWDKFHVKNERNNQYFNTFDVSKMTE